MVNYLSNIRRNFTVSVECIGAQGDGVANGPEGRFYIPFGVPGDQLSITPGKRRGDGREAAISTVIAASPDRIIPACRHFKTCGGCTLQHVATARIAAEKKAMLIRALARRGLNDVPVAETVTVAPETRRRARFAAHNGQTPANAAFHLGVSSSPSRVDRKPPRVRR